ncbi:hypothetical protein LY76DRAFT_492761, partial [Colletotrichum caudatum]
NRTSYIFRGCTLGEILVTGGSRSRVTWRPSDLVIMKSFLAFYRLSGPSLSSLAKTASLHPRRPRDGNKPDFVDLASKLNIDLPSLSEQEWVAIRRKMVSSMTYTLDKNLR